MLTPTAVPRRWCHIWLQHRQDDAAMSCGVEAAQDIPVTPWGTGQLQLGHKSPQSGAGCLHCRFYQSLSAPVSSLPTCQGPLPGSRRRGLSGSRCHVPPGRQDSSRHSVLSVSRSPLVSIRSHFQDSTACRPAIHARLESRCCLQKVRI